MNTTNINSYPEYKDSLSKYIDTIPVSWKQRRGKYLFKERVLLSVSGSEELLTVSHISGITPRRSKNVTMFKSESTIGYKICKENDIAINTMWAWMGAVAVSRFYGVVSPAYHVYNCITEEFNIKYLDLLLRTPALVDEYRSKSTGLRPSRLRLYPDKFLDIVFPVPPRSEQDQIVMYLDYQLAKINKFIKAKKKLIAVLKEQKQAIINEAVTKGLDPNVKMKPSGIEWLGDVPEHWEIAAVKYFARSNLDALNESTYENAVIRYIDIGSVGFGELKYDPESYRFKDAPSRARRIVSYGDTIISTVRTYLKSMLFIDENLQDCIVSTGFCVVSPLENVYPKLLSYILTSNYFVNMVSQNSIGISYPAISESRIMSLKIAIPDSIEEQKYMLEHIVETTSEIDRTIEVMDKEISLASELKNCLISDVVTGKVDVRDIIIEETEEVVLEESDIDDGSDEDEILELEGGDE